MFEPKEFKKRCKCANCGFVFDYYDPLNIYCAKCGSNALDEVK